MTTNGRATVTPEERYRFDLEGYLAVPDALDSETLATINRAIDERLATSDPGAKAVSFGTGGGEVLAWGQAFVDLIDNPRIASYLEEFVDPYFRLDHEYVHVLRPAAGSLAGELSSAVLHGGATPFDASQYYRFSDNRVWSGLTVVAYYLRDVNPGDGGLAVVPGSHKANYPIPEHLLSLDGELPPFVRPVPAPAGTAVIFTEAQTHGTLPWRGRDERRTLFYKYSPHAVSWSWRYYNPDEYEGLTERQREILEPPNGRSPKRRPVLVIER
jgi:ectoine hydroxylase-related dioxygenase (phytanoyl-CoA dioxygenase family)